MPSKRRPPVVRYGSQGEEQLPSAPLSSPGSAKVSVLPLSAEESEATARAQVLNFPAKKERRGQGSGRRWLPWLAAAVVLVVVAVIMAVVLFSPALAVKTITVDGTKLATNASVETALASLKGKSLTQISQPQVQQLLAKLPQVESVSIEARPPSTLLVHIIERVPVAVLKNGNKYVLVDPQGTQLGVTANPATAKLPLIDGGTAAIGQVTFSAITAVLASLPAGVRAQLQSASAKSPSAVELLLTSGQKVYWGDASEMALKSKVLQTLLKNPPKAVLGKPDPAPINVYDVSSPRHPVTR
ncbi:cell division protein FtsQ [Psychromicrobium silvestre]|uniref:Cell division protein FtsQ n=1 Tax=Psychromicrobium silvestre TaxID=1645614 RepID=A0A7Y9LQY8_9MICC|nr:FtsQ-type POTRA domain-containing protein [Psychromicrobium silvestre]NYE93971.1 cell division protein FtsQ [Psychromicrobium silvestre]